MSNKAHAQIHCEIDTIAAANTEVLMAPYRSQNYSNYSFCVRIYVHVIRKSNHSGGQSPADVSLALSYLDTAFNPHNIYFVWDHQIDYIDDDSEFYSPGASVFDINNHTDGVDIYMYDDSVGFLGWDGYGTSQRDKTAFLVSGFMEDPVTLQTYPLVKSHILSHEMGHILTLWHTHHGTGENTDDDEFECPEFVDGSNSATCGDYISDTPADPDMDYYVDFATCQWLDSGFDGNGDPNDPNDPGDPYDPDEYNIMGHSVIPCISYLTPKQGSRMRVALTNLPVLNAVSNYTISGYPCATAGLTYYPNAMDGELNLDLREKPANTYQYQIFNAFGVMVLSGESQNVLKTIETSGLDDGIYFLHFYDNGQLTTKQLIVDH
ncbi:zinc-dependent metalloprotease [Aequorivita flava]|uniref:Zinc-dependent metalloprotease n=1 Tax=Aequorivita flava TaxID=3114371 RepID=A0AB35YNM3_9FLAO